MSIGWLRRSWWVLLACSACVSERASEPQPTSVIEHVRKAGVPIGSSSRPAAALPRTASARLTFGAVDVQLLDLRDVAGVDEQGARVFPNVSRGVDLVYAPVSSGIEELRVVHDPSALRALHYRVRGRVRVRDGAIEVLDDQGHLRFGSEPIVAIDAHGARRTFAPTANGCEIVVPIDLEGLVPPIVVDPLWKELPSMLQKRAWHTSTLLPSGKVLVAGGGAFVKSTGPIHSTAELFDPTTETFTATTPMTTPRWQHSAFSLAGGRVLVIGGNDGLVATTEIYDPSTATWSTSGNVLQKRMPMNVAMTGSGKVLLVGGSVASTTQSTTELYDPTSGSWSPGPSLLTPRVQPVMVTLADGRVVLFGTASYGSQSTGEIFDPMTESFSPMTPSPSPLEGSIAATRLSSGKVLFVDRNDKAWIWDPSSGMWTAVTSAPTPWFTGGVRSMPIATDLGPAAFVRWKSQTTYLAAYVEVYDPASDSWAKLDALTSAPSILADNAATALPGGRILITGGNVVTDDPPKGDSSATAGIATLTFPQKCTAGSECPSGNCVDGYCCDSACTGQCEACDVPSREGICSPSFEPHGSRPACSKDPSSCNVTVCDGTNRATCVSVTAGMECAAAACIDAVTAQDVSTCVGATCTAGPTKSCIPYRCSSGACGDSCTTDAECAPGYVCAGAACVAVTPDAGSIPSDGGAGKEAGAPDGATSKDAGLDDDASAPGAEVSNASGCTVHHGANGSSFAWLAALLAFSLLNRRGARVTRVPPRPSPRTDARGRTRSRSRSLGR